MPPTDSREKSYWKIWNLLEGFSKMIADTEISTVCSQSTMFPAVELPNHGTSGKMRSKMSQTGFSFSDSRIMECIWKHIVGFPCSLHHLLNRKSSFSNSTAFLKENILFFIIHSQCAGSTLARSYNNIPFKMGDGTERLSFLLRK